LIHLHLFDGLLAAISGIDLGGAKGLQHAAEGMPHFREIVHHEKLLESKIVGYQLTIPRKT
jgi:hypothetical protein